MVDYSKWKNIEISDDEDDTHPNIDTGSLFRWRHQARLERMEQHENDKRETEEKRIISENKIKELKKKKESVKDQEEIKKIEEKLKQLSLEKEKFDTQWEDLMKTEKLAPWNIDTISKESWSKTIVNKPKPLEDRSKLSDEELEKRYKAFVKKHEAKIKEYAMISRFDDAKSFLMQNQDLVCEEASNYLTYWCLNLEIDGKHDLMEYISKQVISLHYILELGKQMKIDPRGCVSAFFTRIQRAEKDYQDAFDDEVRSFRERIVTRAKKKIEDAMREYEEEERQKRLGPGGLDPQEVFESLPESLQKCFESRDIDLLKQTILTLDPEEAKYHMKRCTDSGLWVPDKNDVINPDDGTYQEVQTSNTNDNTNS